MRVVLQDVQKDINIKMERNVLRDNEETRRVFIRSLGDQEHMELIERVVAECRRIPSTNGRTTMMRASGRSILRECDVWEHDFQNS